MERNESSFVVNVELHEAKELQPSRPAERMKENAYAVNIIYSAFEFVQKSNF